MSMFRYAPLLVALVACAPTVVEPPVEPEPVMQAEPEPTPLVAKKAPPPIETIEPGQPVPAFEITTQAGERINSREVIGQKPFVVVHFATWCPVCEKKLPMVKRALERSGSGILTLAVAWDEEETWGKVGAYVERHGLTEHVKVVRMTNNKRFAIGYDPFGGFPLVLVIHPNGIIAEFQMGLSPSHEEKLDMVLSAVTALQ